MTQEELYSMIKINMYTIDKKLKKNIWENSSLYTEAKLTKTPCAPDISTSSIGVGNIDLIIRSNHLISAGVILELSEREKLCDNFRTSGRSFGPNFGFPYIFYTFSLLPQLKIGRSQPA